MERKKAQVYMNPQLHEKLADLGESYGMSTNALIVFILGDWIDAKYRHQKAMDKQIKELLSTQSDVLENPKMLEMVKEILKDDEEFKENVSKKL